MREITINHEKCIAFLFTICSYIVIFAPYQGDSTMYNPTIAIIGRAFQYCSFFIIATYIVKKRFVPGKAILPIIACTIAFILPFIHSYGRAEFSGLLMMILIIAFLLVEKEIQYMAFIYFRNTWCFFSALGIICYLSYLVSAPLPYKILTYYGGENVGGLEYVQYYVSYNIIFLHLQGYMIRLCGICNEPGWWGTISALLLCADKLNIKKRTNLIIFLAGIASASMAFCLLVVLYICFLLRKRKIIILLIILIISAFVFILPNLDTGNPALNYLISRFTVTDTGFAGDNRGNNIILNQLFNSVLSNAPFWGEGRGYARSMAEGVSYKIYIIDFGLLGFFLMYGILLIGALKYAKNNFSAIAFVLVFFASVYQRPNIFITAYIVVLFGGIEYIKYKNEIENLNRRY